MEEETVRESFMKKVSTIHYDELVTRKGNRK